MEFSCLFEYIEAFVCCHKLIIDGVTGINIFVWSEGFLESPGIFLYIVSYMKVLTQIIIITGAAHYVVNSFINNGSFPT